MVPAPPAPSPPAQTSPTGRAMTVVIVNSFMISCGDFAGKAIVPVLTENGALRARIGGEK
jgi:hypothetical protein